MVLIQDSWLTQIFCTFGWRNGSERGFAQSTILLPTVFLFCEHLKFKGEEQSSLHQCNAFCTSIIRKFGEQGCSNHQILAEVVNESWKSLLDPIQNLALCDGKAGYEKELRLIKQRILTGTFMTQPKIVFWKGNLGYSCLNFTLTWQRMVMICKLWRTQFQISRDKTPWIEFDLANKEVC